MSLLNRTKSYFFLVCVLMCGFLSLLTWHLLYGTYNITIFKGSEVTLKRPEDKVRSATQSVFIKKHLKGLAVDALFGKTLPMFDNQNIREIIKRKELYTRPKELLQNGKTPQSDLSFKSTNRSASSVISINNANDLTNHKTGSLNKNADSDIFHDSENKRLHRTKTASKHELAANANVLENVWSRYKETTDKLTDRLKHRHDSDETKGSGSNTTHFSASTLNNTSRNNEKTSVVVKVENIQNKKRNASLNEQDTASVEKAEILSRNYGDTSVKTTEMDSHNHGDTSVKTKEMLYSNHGDNSVKRTEILSHNHGDTSVKTKEILSGNHSNAFVTKEEIALQNQRNISHSDKENIFSNKDGDISNSNKENIFSNKHGNISNSNKENMFSNKHGDISNSNKENTLSIKHGDISNSNKENILSNNNGDISNSNKETTLSNNDGDNSKNKSERIPNGSLSLTGVKQKDTRQENLNSDIKNTSLNHTNRSEVTSSYQHSSVNLSRLEQLKKKHPWLVLSNFDHLDEKVTFRPDSCLNCFQPDFPVIIDQKTKCQNWNFGKVDLLILIFSAPVNFIVRDAIRNTWGKLCHDPQQSTICLFVIGLSRSDKTNRHLQIENALHSDILQIGFKDSYGNLTLKTISSLKWVMDNCYQVKHVMKTDDDMYVNTELIPRMLMAAPTKNFFGGHCWGPSTPNRDSVSKWFVPVLSFRRDKFPPMCSGTGYIMTIDVVAAVVVTSRNIPFFHLEDVYVAMCLQKLGILPVSIVGFSNMFQEFDACRYRNEVMTSHEVLSQYLKQYWEDIQKCPLSNITPKQLFISLPISDIE